MQNVRNLFKVKNWKEEAKSYFRHRDRKKIFFKSGREIRKGNWRDWEKMIIRKKKRSILRNQKRKWRRFGKDHPSFPVDHNVPKLAKVGGNFWQNISYHTHMLRKRGKKRKNMEENELAMLRRHASRRVRFGLKNGVRKNDWTLRQYVNINIK